MLHFEAFCGVNMLHRNDDTHRLFLTSSFMYPTTIPEGPQTCYLLCIVTEDSKMNHDGHAEVGCCMRHRFDPLLCSHFSLGYLLFYRWNITCLPIPDFKPKPPNASGVRERPWYLEFLLPGCTKASAGSPVCNFFLIFLT